MPRQRFDMGSKSALFISGSARFPTESTQNYSHDWLLAWLLHREAQTLIEGKKAEPKK